MTQTQTIGIGTSPEDASSDWRHGRPTEDPAKMKKLGFISAQPSEYLIHYRNGKLREASSGQGATCFKWPSDTVAIVPTTLKEISFQANQITVDNVDTRIRGAVVYHIVEPLKIYRLINFSYRERGEEKLAKTIADMCRSNAKWLIANMTIEECIRKRKEEIGNTLKAEIAKVVVGNDPEAGWGIAIDNVDIQDIYINDSGIFSAMQEKFRAEKKLEATQAALQVERQKATLENENRTAAEIARLSGQEQIAEVEKRQKMAALDHDDEVKTHAAKLAQQEALTRVETAEALRTREAAQEQTIIALNRATEEAQLALDRYRVEQNEQISTLKAAAEAERARITADSNRYVTEQTVAEERSSNEAEIDLRREMSAIDNTASEGYIAQLFIRHAVPEIAKAFSAQFSQIRFSHFGGGDQAASAMGPLVQSFQQILEVAETYGIDLGRVLRRGPDTRSDAPAEDGADGTLPGTAPGPGDIPDDTGRGEPEPGSGVAETEN